MKKQNPLLWISLIALLGLGFFFLKDRLFGMSAISLDAQCLSSEPNNATQIEADLNLALNLSKSDFRLSNIPNYYDNHSNCQEFVEYAKTDLLNNSNYSIIQKDGRDILYFAIPGEYSENFQYAWCNKDNNIFISGNKKHLDAYWSKYIHCNVLCYELVDYGCNQTWKADCTGNNTYSSNQTCLQARNTLRGCAVDANCTKEIDTPNDCSLFFKGGKQMQNGVCAKKGCEYPILTSNCSSTQLFLQKNKLFIGIFLVAIIGLLIWFAMTERKKR